jgi:hypothetical protein
LIEMTDDGYFQSRVRGSEDQIDHESRTAA